MESLSAIKHRIISCEKKIIDALNQLNENAGGVLFVTNHENRLLGTLTDGDIRRTILASNNLDIPVTEAMYKNPLVAYENTTSQERLSLMYDRNISFLPVIDETGIFLGAVILQNNMERTVLPNEAVIMCGGLGSRLGELTRNCPKPMLHVGGVPILERILKGLISHGIINFFLATNYLREQIEGYFKDGSRWNINIRYLHENKRLGTGGALSLLPYHPDVPILIMNGDILTDINFKHLLNFHSTNDGIATMGIVEFKYQNPYGVIRYKDSMLTEIEEKPVQSWYINSGIYVISPQLLNYVPKDKFIDMPTILIQAKETGKKVNVYPIYENWLDIGKKDDFDIAQTLI